MSEDAIDLKYAKQVADYLHADHTEVIINKEIVLNALEEVIAMLGTWDITTIRASVGMYLVCKYIHEHTDIRVLLTGEISDELFGYKYTDFAPSAHEFQAESQKRIRELFMYDVLRADRSISVNSLEARVPFGDLDFVKYVMSIDPARKMNIYNKGKYLLRKAFEGDWLPESILWREKRSRTPWDIPWWMTSRSMPRAITPTVSLPKRAASMPTAAPLPRKACSTVKFLKSITPARQR